MQWNELLDICTASTKCLQVEDYVKCCTWRLEKVKLYTSSLISSLKCFNLLTMDCDSRLQSDIVRGKKSFVSVESYNRDNERRGMHVSWLSQGWLKSVFFRNGYFFGYFISQASLRPFSRLRQFKYCNMLPTLYV